MRQIPFFLVLFAAAFATAAPSAAATIPRGQCCSSVNGVCISFCYRDGGCSGAGDCKLFKSSSAPSSTAPGFAEALRTLEPADAAELLRLVAQTDTLPGFAPQGTVTFFVDGVASTAGAPQPWFNAVLETGLRPAGGAGTAPPSPTRFKVLVAPYTEELRVFLVAKMRGNSRLEAIRVRNPQGKTVVLRQVRIVDGPTPGSPFEVAVEYATLAAE
jgi:hypothetical protein